MISTAPERCRIGRAHVKTWNPLWDSERYHVSAAMPTGAIKFCGCCGEDAPRNNQWTVSACFTDKAE